MRESLRKKALNARIWQARQQDANLKAERDQLRQQVEKLLGAIDAVKLGGLPPGHPRSARSRMFNAADQVRKELEG
jgi:hypothetical protein